MKINKNKLIIYFYLIIGSLLLYIFNNLYSFCFINLLLIILLCVRLKLDIKNPLLLFFVIFILYQISYPILNALGIKVFEYYTLNEKYYLYNWIATISFFIFYGSVENVNYDKDKILLNINNVLLKFIYFILFFICIFSSLYIIKNGYNTKYDLAQSTNFIIKLGSMSYTALIVFPLYFNLSKNMKKNQKNFYTIITLLLMFFGMFTYGERSYVFNNLIVLILYYFTFNKISFKKVVLIAICSILFLSASSSMKMLFSSDHYKNTIDSDSNFVIRFLNSDFAAAGFNFNFLLEKKQNSVFYGKTYIYDLLSPLEDFLPISKYSPTKWYMNTFWGTRRTGLGFTIIGEGYINFGLIGIIIEMFILARLIKFFYLKSKSNYYSYIIYIGFISLVMYSCRQSLASIISPVIKYHILMAGIIYLINKIIINKKGNI